MKEVAFGLFSVLLLGLFLSFNVHGMEQTYCMPNGSQQTVCNTWHDDGRYTQDYWTKNSDGSSYKSSSFGDSDEN